MNYENIMIYVSQIHYLCSSMLRHPIDNYQLKFAILKKTPLFFYYSFNNTRIYS